VSLDKREEELKRIYTQVQKKTLPDGSGLIRVHGLTLAKGCVPERTDMLLTFPANQNVPNGRYVKDPVKLSSGRSPAYSPTTLDGETWYGFSYNVQWNPNYDVLYQYVESILTRFAKSE